MSNPLHIFLSFTKITLTPQVSVHRTIPWGGKTVYCTYQRFNSHISDILEYWKKAVDYEAGGIHFWLDDFEPGTVMKLGGKCLLMHVRQLYDYAVGIKYGIAGSPEIARHLYTTLDTVFPSHGGLYESGMRFRRFFRPDRSMHILFYDQLYTVIGLAKYAWATGDATVYAKAKGLYDTVMAAAVHHPFERNGLYAHYSVEDGHAQGKNGNTHLHHLEALLTLWEAATQTFTGDDLQQELAGLRETIGKAYELFTAKLFDRQRLITPDDFNEEFQLSPKNLHSSVTMGHPLEWVGFWREAQILTGEQYPFLESDARSMVDATIARAVAPNGCFRNYFFLKEQLCAGVSDFWGQVEAVLGLLYAAQSCNEPRYREAAEACAGFYFEHYIDKEYGGIYLEMDQSGIATDRVKGSGYKCDHHCLRMCEKTIRYRLLDDAA
jgi:mannose/cellobiose epimerase-like protein (N-acyl-D-glucosamine 2-epimerase family)